METNKQNNLDSIREIVSLPQLQVLNDALEDVRRFEEEESKRGCIFWGGYMCEFFTRADLSILKDILEFSMKTRKEIQVEQYAMKKKTVCPPGMPNLDGRFKKAISEAWHERVEEHDLNLNADLGEFVSGEELIQNAMAEESKKMFENKKLNTESVQKMLHPNGFMTSDAIEYFCRLLEERHPGSLYIYLNQALSSKDARILNAIEINVKNSRNIYFIFSRSQTKILDTRGNNPHYATATIREDGNVYYGDGYFELVPSNLKEIINDYYFQKFGNPLKLVENMSRKRNFPVQDDAHLCGFICLMLVTLMEDENIFKMILSKTPLKAVNLRQDYLISSPSNYNLYLRQVFMTAYSESQLDKRLFLSENCNTRISQIVKEPTKKNQFHKKVSKDKGSIGNKTPIKTTEPKRDMGSGSVFSKNLFDNFVDLVGDEEEMDQPENTRRMETDQTKDTGSKSSMKMRKKDSSLIETDSSFIRSSVSKNKQDERRSRAKTAEEAEISNSIKTTVENFQGNRNKEKVNEECLVSPSFLGKLKITADKLQFFSGQYKANQDGYQWERIIKKNKDKRCKKNRYRCLGIFNGIQCPAEKEVFFPFGGNTAKQKIVEYCVAHSHCEAKSETENAQREEGVIQNEKEYRDSQKENFSRRMESEEENFSTGSKENKSYVREETNIKNDTMEKSEQDTGSRGLDGKEESSSTGNIINKHG